MWCGGGCCTWGVHQFADADVTGLIASDAVLHVGLYGLCGFVAFVVWPHGFFLVC